MSISKLITSASLAFALIGGTLAFSPSDAQAARAQKISKNFIKFPPQNGQQNTGKGNDNKHDRNNKQGQPNKGKGNDKGRCNQPCRK